MFKPFINGLIGVRKKLIRARDLVKTDKPESCKRAEGLLNDAIHGLDEVKPIYYWMVRVLMFLKGARIFVSKLIIIEVVLGLIGITLVFVLNRYLTAAIPKEIVKLLSDPWFQKQSLLVTTLFIAPLVALCLTVRGLNK